MKKIINPNGNFVRKATNLGLNCDAQPWLLVLAAILYSVTAAAADDWGPLQFLVGRWTGGGDGVPGEGTGDSPSFRTFKVSGRSHSMVVQGRPNIRDLVQTVPFQTQVSFPSVT
jgi:hypothetical protein